MDAAIAAAAVMSVIAQPMGGLGGDAFMLVWRRGSPEPVAINANGAAPMAATMDAFPTGIPNGGPRAATVPGVVDGWATAVDRFGSLPLRDLLQPAIEFAEAGFVVGDRLHAWILDQEDRYRSSPSTAHVFFPDGRVPEVGEVFRQPDLAWTLRAIAEGGRDAFYHGEVAQRIVTYMRDVDGLLAAGDLAAHRTEVLAPVGTTYRGHKVFEQPPPSQGFVLLEELSILEGFDIAAMDVSSADAIHLMVEAKKLAFADRDMLYGDQRFVSVPLEEMLSKEHAKALRSKIDPTRAALRLPVRARAGLAPDDTTYLAVADAEGNCVSYIHSLFAGIGAVADGTGVLLNDRMRGFSLDPARPDSLRPGKYPTNTLNSYMVFRDGVPRLIGGTPGGHAQVQTSFQILSDLLDHGSSPTDAIERPRWRNGDRSGSPSLDLAVEGRFEPTVLQDLVGRGHRIQALGNWSPWTGSVKLIEIDHRRRTLTGAVDPRIEAAVAGW